VKQTDDVVLQWLNHCGNAFSTLDIQLVRMRDGQFVGYTPDRRIVRWQLRTGNLTWLQGGSLRGLMARARPILDSAGKRVRAQTEEAALDAAEAFLRRGADK
jgi:hypothetical protein